jgi:hypothetical protein
MRSQLAHEASADWALPARVEEYRDHMKRSMDFVNARNNRIAQYAATHLEH